MVKNLVVNRTHQTEVGTSLSVIAALISGVIQGSGIGPIMFVMYVDDFAKLIEQINVTVNLFADGVKVYLKVDNVDNVYNKKLS